MASRRVRIFIGVTAVLVLGGVVAGSVIRDNRSKVVVQTLKASKRDLVSVVSASGEIKPKRYVNIGANVSGRIEKLLVKEGDNVRKGQVLARIESTRFAADLRQTDAAVGASQADLQRAEADLEASRLAFERTRSMHAEKLVSDQTFEQADAELKMKRAAVAAQKKHIAQQSAASESTRDTLEKAVVVSSMDGVITSLPKEEGEVVIGAQSFSPTVIMTVADLSVMEVEIMVDETDIRNLKLGQKAQVRVDALEGVKIEGDVTEIGSSAIPRGSAATAQQQGATSANTGSQAKDFKVEVTLHDPPASLRPGLNATADITTDHRDGVVAVPIQAVVVREVDKSGKAVDPDSSPPPEAGEPTQIGIKRKVEEREGVFVVAGGLAAFRPVKTGIIGETDIEIVEGLKAGEEIVTGSYKTLRSLKDQAKIKLEVRKEHS